MNLEGLTSEDAKKVFAQRLCIIIQILIFLIAMIVIGNIIFLGYNGHIGVPFIMKLMPRPIL